MSTGRFQPYGRSRARRSEHMNAEAGPSTLVPPPVLCVGLPTLQPSGGMISETTADAEKSQTITEEDEVSVSNFYCSHILRVIEWSFDVRRSPSGASVPTARRCGSIPPGCTTGCSADRGPRKLQTSTRLWPVSICHISRNSAPDPIDHNTVALETISTIRPLVYHEECLAKTKGHSGSTGPRSKKAEKEGRRRKAERKLFQALSKYYPMGPGQNSWTRPPLFLRGKHEHSAQQRYSTYLNSSQS